MAYEDLLKDSSTTFGSSNDYFLVTITDLDVNQSSPIQFRWKYNDGTFSPWSAVKVITTPGESDPNTPKFTDSNVDVTTPGFIKITWDGTSDDATPTPLTDIDRVDVYIDGLPFDGTKPAASFKTAGTQVIAAPGGTYQIVLYAVSKLGKLSPVSVAVTKTDSDISNQVVDPEDPEAPTVTAGLASVIVEWSGKKSGGGNFPTGSFAGAKVFIGTSAGFTPSDNNWVHTLNFANGSNKVSIGVGTIIDKSAGTLLQYNTPYYVKIDTINANGTSNNNPIAASGNPITVNKVAASEIITGTLAADASITAGIDGGSRVVLSGGANPLVIYGTNGTTELLKFTGGATGTLTVNGGGTFTGDLSAGSGSSIFKSDSSGIYLGNAVYASAPFSVSRNGVLKAESGTIGGWILGSTYLQNASTSPTIKIDTTGIIVGSTSNPYIDITSSGITHREANGTASGKFTLTTGPSAQLTIDGTFTISGTSTINGTAASTVVSNASAGSTAIQDGNGVTKNASNQITRISTNGGIVVSSSTASSGSRVELTNTGFYAYNSSGQETVGIDAGTGSARFSGQITSATGTIAGFTMDADGLINSGSTLRLFAGTTGINNVYSIYTTKPIRIGQFVQIQGNGFGGYSLIGEEGMSLANGNFAINSSGTVTSNATFNAYIYYPGYPVSTSGGAARVNDATTPSSRLVAASGSSIRFKENIVNISEKPDLDPSILLSLPVRSFTYKQGYLPEDDARYGMDLPGFIAEELEEIYPIAVDRDADGTPQRWNADFIIPGLLKIIQTQNDSILSITSRLDALES